MTIDVSVLIVKFTARNIGGGFRHPPAGGRSRQLHIVSNRNPRQRGN